MSIDLIVIGKTDSAQIASLVEMYSRRISHYARFAVVVVPDEKALMKQLAQGDWVVLLDDKGAAFTSLQFASWLQRRLVQGGRRLCFVVGGAFGFSHAVRARANELLSLSPLTFSHQIVRAIFAEQLYRAFSILNNEPYHHE